MEKSSRWLLIVSAALLALFAWYLWDDWINYNEYLELLGSMEVPFYMCWIVRGIEFLVPALLLGFCGLYSHYHNVHKPREKHSEKYRWNKAMNKRSRNL